MTLYYPQGHGERLDEDLRLLYDHMYRQHGTVVEGSTAKAPSALAGSASHTKIAGLNVRGILPTSGAGVTNLSKIPVLGYDVKSGDITWFIPM